MKIKLKCTYSGDPKKHGEPGDVIDVAKGEAERLIGLGAAEAVKAEDDGDASLLSLKELAGKSGVDISAATSVEEIEAALKAAGVAIPA